MPDLLQLRLELAPLRETTQGGGSWRAVSRARHGRAAGAAAAPGGVDRGSSPQADPGLGIDPRGADKATRMRTTTNARDHIGHDRAAAAVHARGGARSGHNEEAGHHHRSARENHRPGGPPHAHDAARVAHLLRRGARDYPEPNRLRSGAPARDRGGDGAPQGAPRQRRKLRGGYEKDLEEMAEAETVVLDDLRRRETTARR